MDDTSSDFHHGEMPVQSHVHTYELFNRLTKWFCLHAAVLILVFTLWFCVGVGFWGGIIPGAIVLAAGIFFLRSRPEHVEP